MMALITKEMNIQEVVNKYPQTTQVFLNHGLHCLGCFVASYESIEQGASAHGMDIDCLVSDLNAVVSS